MSIVEITDKDRVSALLEPHKLELLEALDENVLGIDGIVSVYCQEEEHPANMVVVRWAQGSMGLRNIAHVFARKLTDLEDVISAVPTLNAQYDAWVPFWASPALGTKFQAEVQGAVALYRTDENRLTDSPVTRQCVPVEDQRLVKPMFRKLAEDSPAYALSLKDKLASVAVVTHLREQHARLQVYTVDDYRGRGFGRGVLTALTDELLAMKIVPTIVVDLSNEAAVRMVEAAGYYQAASYLKTQLVPLTHVAAPGSLVQLGKK